MSYCRWSTNDYQCDVYVYEDASGGWTTHVARRRWTYTTPLPEPVSIPRHASPDEDWRVWAVRDSVVTRMHGKPAHGYWTDLPESVAGRTFSHDTPGECADNLEALRDAGLNVPQDAIDTLREEDNETR